MIYTCTDGYAEVEIEAESAREAAQEYVDGGDWGDREKTIWIDVYVTNEFGESEGRIKITVDPYEPPCESDKHDWQSPYEIVGGIRENPGVWGNGGGVIITSVCMHCGCGRHVNTWDYQPDTGEQGLESVRYVKGEFSEEVDRIRKEEE